MGGTKLFSSTRKHIKSFYQVHLLRQRCSPASVSVKERVVMKLNTPIFYSIFTPELKLLQSVFDKYNFEIRIVGGAVRDLLSGIKPHDLDFATTAEPEEMKGMFEAENIRIFNKRGEKHGTITTRIDDKVNFEITTLRTDLYCNGRHAKVLFTTDWKKDAARRDLTINSMYLGLDGNVYDYFGGYEDLKNKKILFVGDPEKRIQEDYLRILRYFRFFGRIVDDPGSHDLLTLQAIQGLGHGLAKISGERIWIELSQILTGNFKKEIVETMLDLGLGKYIGLDETETLDMDCFRRICDLEHKHQHKFLPITCVSALLKNDHQLLQFHERMKLSSIDRDLAFFLVYHKADDISLSSDEKIKALQFLVLSTTMSREQIMQYIFELLRFKDEPQLISQFQSMKLPTFPINKSLLQQFTKIRNPKYIASIKQKLTEIWVCSNFKLTTNELLQEIPKILEEGNEKNNKNK